VEAKFDPQAAESRLYKWWRDDGLFTPDETKADAKTYSITIPPPNVTGSLHMGHALCYSIQDILGRWKRMQGFQVLIVPGVDHAGIATQNVVEKEIAAEGLTRHDLGRDQFVERVWNWKERYGARIINQLQRLGCSFDWSGERFTMDDGYVDAILEEFVRFYDKGWIYRGARVINWCPRCATAISDIEVEYVERDSHLWHIAYPFADGSGSVTVATTRPETMLGDTAVAVNPNDPRYAGLIGKTIVLPLVGREIPLIADDYASLEFGTGAVKVTPAHDLNDFECGLRHHLAQIVVIGEDGRMTAAAGDVYARLTREEAREAVVRDLEAAGALVKIEDYRHSVATCERCHTIIEPLLSEQWFVKMAGTEMVQRAIDAVEAGEVAFVPERYKQIYIDWMLSIRDWCISRQLWWGHRIPIYYTHDGKYTAAKTAEAASVRLGVPVEELRQDEDVLDTWFSSALWPFATMGWPQKTETLERFYPTDVLVTSREIMFLWVARMIMTGLELVGTKPFEEVYVYATVLDAKGRRMSKSLGNGIDPVEMIELFGADALRFSLVRLASKGQDIKFSEDRIPESRNFCTKIWNASKFALLNLEGAELADLNSGTPGILAQRWILSRLQHTIDTVNATLGTYDIDESCRALYEFFWNDFCDWFVELAKQPLRDGTAEERLSAQATLYRVLRDALKLLHPFMPFITEEIWQELPGTSGSIEREPFPVADPQLVDHEAERQMDMVIAMVRGVRNARAELAVPAGQWITAEVVAADILTADVVRVNSFALTFLARVRTVDFVSSAPAANEAVSVPVNAGLGLYLPLAGMVDIEKEKKRLDSELAKIEKDLAQIQARLNNPQFVAKAAPELVTREQNRLVELTSMREQVGARRKALR
jgi:valyl-tRNA synthetase